MGTRQEIHFIILISSMVGSGGGIVPPTDSGLPDTGNEGDKPGHPVVEEPISFTVTVEDWTEADVKDPSMN